LAVRCTWNVGVKGLNVTPQQVADYMGRYITEYRAEYERLTALEPHGAGYPRLAVSPYFGECDLLCLIADDGVAVVDQSQEPPYDWWIAGGPALMADFPDSRTTPEVQDRLQREGLSGQDIGIYRVVSRAGIPSAVWNGELTPLVEEVVTRVGQTFVRVQRLALTQLELLQRLTYGALGLILDIQLATPDSDFWRPHVIRSMGFFPADRHARRFFNYLELSGHLDKAAWDHRAIHARVQSDLRRDFGWAFSLPEQGCGSISFGRDRPWVQPFRDRLLRLHDAIGRLEATLEAAGNANEDVFHQVLQDNPILLDVYGEAISKPRLQYPEGESPLGKAYVEPDFIVRYPGRRYRLVELEKPAKGVATAQGQPRAELTQSAFQVAEWKAYITNHYDLIRAEYPGISTACDATIVISRSNAVAFGHGRDISKYQELLRVQYPGIDILTYDDLVERARTAYILIASLGFAAGEGGGV
jgi:hypothetical protein